MELQITCENEKGCSTFLSNVLSLLNIEIDYVIISKELIEVFIYDNTISYKNVFTL